ncbi:hypothetical protein H4684_002637 [Desulfomicrobium macestii]|uniref:PEP-CTERM protein-sorting domain-containing protein n=1 Tax=Desulfomicrobium macestii TaxID=90731 RepID=A0ABR9H5H6_9BACT|nr:VPLPA-CTERM sorting domain-containing protein [Desulfomicrobium macestii]MBE1425978.1 hypothetical protein [Desulfomicrobium macestii]
MKKVALLTIGLLMVCNFAFAAIHPIDTTTGSNFDVGELVISDIYYGKGDIIGDHGTEFTHIYNFSVSTDFSFGFGMNNSPNIQTVPFINTTFDFLDLEDSYNANLYSSNGGDSIIGGKTFAKDFLDAGSYYLKLIGTTSGTDGGSYNVSFAASNPVPVPAAALLLGAGLLGIVGIRRRQIS